MDGEQAPHRKGEKIEMARAKLKSENVQNLKMFLTLCGGSIDFESGSWYLETGNKLKILHSTEDLNEYITGELETLKGNYTPEEWESAQQEASKSRFHLKWESDKIDMRRYRYGKDLHQHGSQAEMD